MEHDPKDKKFPWKGDLWKYAFKGEVKKVKKIIKKGGIQINEYDEFHRSALHYAAMGGDIETIKALIEGGAKIDSQHRYGSETPLMVALKQKNTDAALALVRLGANPNVENQWHKTSLDLSKDCGKRFELQFAEECRRYASARASAAPPAASSAAAASKPKIPDLPAAPVIPKYMTAAERAEAEKAEREGRAQAAAKMSEMDSEYAKKFGLDEDEAGDVSGDVMMTSADGSSKEALFGRLKDQQKMFIAEPSAEGGPDANSANPSPAEKSMTSSATSEAAHKKGASANSNASATSAAGMSAALAERAKQNAAKKMTKEQADRARLLKRRIQRLELVSKSLAIWPTKLPQKGNAANAAAEARRLKKEAAAEEYRQMKLAAEKKENDAAVLMIKHLLGWFDPRIPRVTLAEWTPRIDVHKKYGSLESGAAAAAAGSGENGEHSVSGTPGNVFTKWCRVFHEIYLDSHDMDVQYIIKDCRRRVSGMAGAVTGLDRTCDTYIQELDDRYPLVKEEVKYLKKRVLDINKTCNDIGGSGRGSNVAPFQHALSTAIGATYWTFNSLHKFSLDEMVALTKEFVESLLSLGAKLDSEVETTLCCLRLANVIDGITFYQKDPAVSREIAEALNTLQAATRTLVLSVFQGGDRSSEYNTIIGVNLGKIKSVVSSTVPSRRKSQISSQAEGELAEKAVKYFISTIKFYKPFAAHSIIKDLLKEIAPIPKLFVEFLRHYTIIRDTTALELSSFLRAGLTLADDLERFREEFLSPEFDPDDVFRKCSVALEQCIHQFLIAVVATVFENANCPRYEIAIAIRALCFTLVTAMDLCYISAN